METLPVTTSGSRSRERTIVVHMGGRPRMVERLAMRLGLALILWGQRGSRRRLSLEEVQLLRAASDQATRERRDWHRYQPPFR